MTGAHARDAKHNNNNTHSTMKVTLCFLILIIVGAFAADLISEEIYKPEKCDEVVESGDRIEVHYVGTLLDGKEFDNSVKRGKPIDFTVGVGSVIKGWDRGLIGLCVGEKRKLTIPSELAYGDRAVGKVIPAGATLVFQVEIVGLKKKGK